MYIFFPNTRVKTIPALCGAALAGFFWFAVQNLYISLQVGVAKYNAIYGSFATVPLFLVWMYLGWLFILLGAQVAFALQNVRDFRIRQVEEKPAVELSAALDIMAKVYRAFESGEKLDRELLHASMPEYQPQLVDKITQNLITAEFLHLANPDARILPTLPRDHFSERAVLKLVLGDRVPDTGGGKASLAAIEAAGNFCKE
jgi:membrane protein